MINTRQFTGNAVDLYHENGFSILEVFDEGQVRLLEEFAKSWIFRLLSEWTAGKEKDLPLEKYHVWSGSLNVDHSNVFRAVNRHTNPPQNVEDVLLNHKLIDFLKNIGLGKYRIWDEGLGRLAFRFIRPGAGDGYPLTRKAWGIATNVISCWVPIIGYSQKKTLTVVPGSHLKEYEKYLPTDGKFRKDEYRFAGDYADLEFYHPELKRGEIIVYHPMILHSEDVTEGDTTRLNLEFRLEPL